ncbi:DUF7289 family protein [Haloarcula marina]|uniref:DUF7289 family protein n=1 Tax=Haloarcula marina TaxID=2961574 RepID=UPI0020B6F34F|nr:hypothetical protein [Halomicroarcula marina]
MGLGRVLPGERGQSAPLGMALVFAVMILGTTAVLALGVGAITTTQAGLEDQRSQKAMTQLDSQAALVALGNTDAQSVVLPSASGADYTVDESAGSIRIEHEKTGTTTTLVDRSLGTVQTSGTSTSLAYQGGGVWRKTDNGSVMVSPPEFHYRNATLTLPIISVEGDDSLSDRASIRRTAHDNVDVTNPIRDGTIVVTVDSAYYKAWGRYFETRTDGEVSYDHANDRVTIDLVTPIGQTRVQSAVAGLSSGDLSVQGNGGTPCGGAGDKIYTDSYNSSKPGDYCAQYPGSTGNNGNITFGGDVDYQGNANFNGDIRSGGVVDITGNADINGDIYWTDSFSASGAASYDSATQISGVQTQSRINDIVGAKGREIADDNDNAAAGSAITGGDRLADGDHTLTTGSYHFADLTVDEDDTLTLDTSGGDVTIAVDEYVDVEGEIEVTGDNVVRLYVRTMGANPSDGKVSTGWRNVGLRIHDDGEVVVPGNDAPQLRVYGNDTLNASVDDGEFTGVIWAPVGGGAPGGFEVTHGDVYGGIVSGDVFIRTQGRIHYDQALEEEQIVSRDASVARITYVHISENVIEFED